MTRLDALRPAALVCLTVLALAIPAAAVAKAPPSTTVCRNRIINEWEGTGKIATTFPVACYKAALSFVNGQQDLKTYSSLADDIRLALAARLQRAKGQSVPSFVGKHGKTSSSTTTSTTPVSGGSTGGGTTVGTGSKGESGVKGGNGKGPRIQRGGGDITTVAAPGTTSTSSGTPLPIIILGAVAVALVAAGAIGTGIRHQRRRRP